MTTRARLLLASLALLLPLALTPALPARAAGDWLWPVAGEVISTYRNGDDPYAGGQHRGIDVAAESGTPVVAAAAGTVRHAGVAGSSGLTVSVRTADGRYDTAYLHLSEAAVSEGEEVAAGDRLGSVGVTGRRSSEAPHLHFGVREAGSRHAYVDPLGLLGPPVAPPVEAPRPAPVPVEAPVPVAPAPAPVPRAAPAPVPRPVTVPEPAPGPVRSPQPRRVPLGRRVPGARRAPAPRGAPPPAVAPAPAAVPALDPTPATGAAEPSPQLGSRPEIGPAPDPRPASGGRSAPRQPTQLRPEAPARPARDGATSAGGQASTRGPDVGWALACAGLLLAAACLGRPGDRSEHGGTAHRGRRALAALRALVRPLGGRR
jgi:hypothetical protein